jgi:hypothetical protein
VAINLPDEFDRRSYTVQFGGHTYAEVLQQTCELHGLTYRVESDGSITLESKRRTRDLGGMEETVYWLKEAKLPADRSLEKYFAEKGVSFPKGASVKWQPAVRQLTVVNSPENVAKVAQIIDAELGGSVGSPTHWLTLNNGGQIGLTVDKFEEDSISGRHPIFGACKVPMKDVCTVQTSPLEPTPTMKSLADWYLVNAPEPVIPDEGGDS